MTDNHISNIIERDARDVIRYAISQGYTYDEKAKIISMVQCIPEERVREIWDEEATRGE